MKIAEISKNAAKSAGILESFAVTWETVINTKLQQLQDTPGILQTFLLLNP